MYRLTVLPTEELLKMINDYFTDTAINIDNYSITVIIKSTFIQNIACLRNGIIIRTFYIKTLEIGSLLYYN